MTVFNSTMDTATPAGSDDPSEADDRMRETKAAVQERLAVDHKFSLTGTEVSATDSGEHTKITFNVTLADPTQVSGKAHLYMKNDELFYQDDTNTTKQLTNGGALNIVGAEILGILANNTFFTAVDNAGTGTVDLIKADASDVPVVPDGIETATDAAPASDKKLANKKYTDAAPKAQMKFNNVSDASASGATDSEGSTTFPNGTIMKWGKVTVSSDPTTVTFSVAFPNANFQVIAQHGENQSDTTNPAVYNLTTTGFTVKSPSSHDIRWFAIGR